MDHVAHLDAGRTTARVQRSGQQLTPNRFSRLDGVATFVHCNTGPSGQRFRGHVLDGDIRIGHQSFGGKPQSIDRLKPRFRAGVAG